MIVSFPDASWRADVGPVAGVEPVLWDPADGPRPDLGIEVVVAPYLRSAGELAAIAGMPSVRLVQLLTAGFDGVLEAVPGQVAVANAVGVHDSSTAELAVTLALAALRGIPEAAAAQRDGAWRPMLFRPALADRRVLLIGYGGIGQAIARRLQGFEVAVSAVGSRARPGDGLVDEVQGPDAIAALLPDAEVVILAVPLSTETHHLVDDAFIAALPDGALVVNVSRGPVVDTEAILRAAGRVRFALDVTDPEPLPAGHPLFAAPSVLITPHVGGPTSAFRPRAVALLRDQLTRVGAGEAPRHLVRGAW